MLLLYIIILLISFYLLARVCDEYFVDSLDKIADKLKMSSDVAGATLMAVGSSAPELFVSIIALVKPGGHGAVGMGTIIGSALFNILVIIGASAAVKRAYLTWQPVVRDTLFYSLSIIILLVTFWDGHITWLEAGAFVILYIIYVIAVMNWRKLLPYKDKKAMDKAEDKIIQKKRSALSKITKPLNIILDKLFPPAKYYYAIFFISIAIIAGLSWVLVESAVAIADILHIPAAIVALTILAAGTSIPDLISSMIVAKQGRGGMAISNAVGSNIFDILVGLGLPWFIILSFGHGESIAVSTENLLSSIILLFATVLVIFFLIALRSWRIGYRAGYLLIALYVIYLIWAILA